MIARVLLAAAFALLTACGDPAGPEERADAGPASLTELHRGNGSEPQSLDIHKAEGVPSSNIQRDLYEGLVSQSADGSLEPGAAHSWEISDDGRVYVFGEQGTTTVLQPGKQPVKLAENSLDGRILASPAVVDGAIFLRKRGG